MFKGRQSSNLDYVVHLRNGMAFITKYLRVDEKRAVQMEIHPVETRVNNGNYDKKTRRWLQKTHIQEIRSLLKDVIMYQMSASLKNKETNAKSNTNTAEIITGSSVRLGYVFKKKSDQHTLLIPDSDSDTDSETGMKYYTVFGQKIIVYACLIKPGSPRGIPKLLKVLGDNGSQRKSISSISNYFTRDIRSSQKSTSHSNSQSNSSRPVSSSSNCHSSDSSQSTSAESQEERGMIETVIPPAPSSDGKRTALKGLIKRNNEALKRKKRKKADNLKESCSKIDSKELDEQPVHSSKRKKNIVELITSDEKKTNSTSQDKLYCRAEATYSQKTNNKDNFEPVCSNYDNRLSGNPEFPNSLRENDIDFESRTQGPSISISSNLTNYDSEKSSNVETSLSGSPSDTSCNLNFDPSSNILPRSHINADVRSLNFSDDIDNKSDKFCFDDDNNDNISISTSFKHVSAEINPVLSDNFPRITLCTGNTPSDHPVTQSSVTPSNSDIESVTIVGADQIQDVGINIRNVPFNVTMEKLTGRNQLYSCDYTDESVLPCVSFLQRKESICSSIEEKTKVSAKFENVNIQKNRNENISEEYLRDKKKDGVLSPLFCRSKSQKLSDSDQCLEKEKLDQNTKSVDIYNFGDDIQSRDEEMPSLCGGKSQRAKRVHECMSPSDSNMDNGELPKLRKLDKTDSRSENEDFGKLRKLGKTESRSENEDLPKLRKLGKSENETISKLRKPDSSLCNNGPDRSDFNDENFELPKLRKPNTSRSEKGKEELPKLREPHRSNLGDKTDGLQKFQNVVRLESNVQKEELPKLSKLGRSVKRKNETSPNSVSNTAAVDKENVSVEEKPLPSLFKRRLSQLNLIDKDGHILVGDPNENKGELDCVLIEQLSEMPKVKNEETEDIKREIRSLQKVSELNEKQLNYLLLNSVGYLRGIFEGKVSCRRHEEYKKGGKSRQNLNYDVHLGLYTEEQEDIVMTTLMSIFCKKHHKYLDYLMKVLLPEMLIKIYMEVHGTSHEETEDLMDEAVATPGAIFH